VPFLLAAACAFGVARPARAADLAALWTVSLDGSFGAPSGHVQVRENAIEGTRLDLRRDLGVTTSESLALGVARRAGAGEVSLRFEALFLYGSATLGQDVFFNGATLQGGTELETRPEFFRASAFYERPLARLPGGASLRGRAGMTFVFLNFKFHGTLSPTTKATETEEGFLRQELPVPMLGLAVEAPLAGPLSFTASLDGGWLPLVNSLRTEGGVVKLKQSHADLFVGVRGALSRSLAYTAGYRFSYFAQREISREDDNAVRVTSHSLALSLAAGF